MGRTLLQRLIDDCTSMGFRQMLAVTGDGGNSASVTLHERLGFGGVARFRGIGRKHGRWLDAVQMQRSLGDGDQTAPAGPVLHWPG